MKKNSFKIISWILYIISMVLLTVICVPLVKSFNNPDEFKNYIDGFGHFGFIIMMFIQISQVIVAFIPGELVEFVAGTIYGWFGGLIFCLVGIAIGQCIIFIMVRFLGSNLVEKVAGSKFMTKFRFLREEKRLKTVLFILYFIPGTPKDLLTYLVPLTKIGLKDFIIISAIARIPSIVSSTFGGDAFSERNYLSLAIVYIIISIISIGGALLYRYFDNKHSEKSFKNTFFPDKKE